LLPNEPTFDLEPDRAVSRAHFFALLFGTMNSTIAGVAMATKLSNEQRRALAQHPEQPLAVEDPESRRQYVLIRRDVYDELQQSGAGSGPARKSTSAENEPPNGLPDWCNVYEGLSERQIAEVEQMLKQRADFTRPA
jgi:hypothetical protein